MACELFDGPLEGIFLRDVGDVAGGSAEVGVLDIIGDGHEHIHVVGDAFLLIVGLDFDQKPDFCLRRLFNDHVHREKGLDADIEPVAHELELSVWGDECDQSLVLEAA